MSTLFMTVLGQPAFAGDVVGQASLYLLNNYCKTFICMTLKIFTTYPRVTKQTLQVGKHGLVSCEGLPHRPWSNHNPDPGRSHLLGFLSHNFSDIHL